MNDLTTQKPKPPIVQFKENLSRLKAAGELDMLPSNVSYDAFRNAAIVAVTDNPSILQCQTESVFKAIRRLAAAGLVPDGREAAIVPFKGQAQAMPMVAGLIKVARNSGEIASIWAEVVCEGEAFTMGMNNGLRTFGHDYDPLKRGGKVTGAYAVAKLKDGTVEIEAMGRDEIEKRRRASANQRGPEPTGIWQDWYPEMAKKTVIRALVKRLPMSSEDMRRVMIDHEDTVLTREPEPDAPRPNLAQRLAGAKERPAGGDEVPEAEVVSEPHWTASVAWDEAAPGSDAWDEGVAAFQAGQTVEDCPYDGDRDKAADWIGGWMGAKDAAE